MNKDDIIVMSMYTAIIVVCLALATVVAITI